MKLKIAIATKGKVDGHLETKAFVEIPQGIYRASFSSKEVKFYKMTGIEDFVTGDFMEFEFNENDLREKEGCDNVFCYPCCTWYLPDKLEDGEIVRQKAKIEYLKGKIGLHDHNDKDQPEVEVIEIYFSLNAPFKGEVCGHGESHQTFSEETLAVKLILKRCTN